MQLAELNLRALNFYCPKTGETILLDGKLNITDSTQFVYDFVENKFIFVNENFRKEFRFEFENSLNNKTILLRLLNLEVSQDSEIVAFKLNNVIILGIKVYDFDFDKTFPEL